jgi:hypothetical protein
MGSSILSRLQPTEFVICCVDQLICDADHLSENVTREALNLVTLPEDSGDYRVQEESVMIELLMELLLIEGEILFAFDVRDRHSNQSFMPAFNKIIPAHLPSYRTAIPILRWVVGLGLW